MNQIWLILHLFGFAAGVGSSIGNWVVLMLAKASPGDAPVLSKISPRLARVGQIGLALLWITGIILVWSAYGGPGNLPGLFWWKLAGVVLVSGMVGLMDVTVKRVRAGDVAARERLPIYGAINAVLLVLVVILAVYAFD